MRYSAEKVVNWSVLAPELEDTWGRKPRSGRKIRDRR